MVRNWRRYRPVPLVAFVKGHLRVVLKATTKLFDGCEKNTRQKRVIYYLPQQSPFWVEKRLLKRSYLATFSPFEPPFSLP